MEQTHSKVYEGKAKLVKPGPEHDTVIIEFKNDLTAFNAQKKGSFGNKGKINARISELIFYYLKDNGVPSHFLKRESENSWLCQKLEIIPFEVVVRNKVAGSLAKKLGLPEGGVLKFPLVEFYLKNDSLGDPFISEDQMLSLSLIDQQTLLELKKQGELINDLLKKLFLKAQLTLVDFKIEFGKNKHQQVLLADEISPDSCRLWDVKTQQKLDKDRFRQDLGGIADAYEEVLKRLESVVENAT
ncbi:MAG: phosphoribosylaminoimidazolesuccinocarboxamide synthase [Bdellovibrionia bacterium]